MNIFVGNLSYEVSEDDLRGFFTAYGHVANVALISGSYLQSSAPRRKSQYSDRELRGHAYVEMPDAAEAQAAILGVQGAQIRGSAVTVIQALPMEKNTSKKGSMPSTGPGPLAIGSLPTG
jgi:RNA recognition motif-containing protein